MADIAYAEPIAVEKRPNPFLNIPPAPEPPVVTTPTAPPKSSNTYATPQALPPRQQNLRDNGKWDFNPTPPAPQRRPDAPPAPQRQSSQIPNPQQNPSRQRIQDPRYPQGVTAADVEGTAALGAFVLGLYDQLTGTNPIGNPNARRQNQREAFPLTDDLAYRIGRRTAAGAQDTIKDAQESIKRTRDDIWRNRPRFEIPQIKIPEWDIKLPEIKIPEFELPELPKPQPKPKPIPPPKPTPPPPKPTLRDRLKDVDVSPCGRIHMVVAYASRVTGYKDILDDNGELVSTEKIFVQTSLASVTDLKRKYDPYFSNQSDYEIAAFHADGYGGNQTIENSEGYFETGVWGYMVVNEDGYPLNPPFGRLNYPYQQASMYHSTAIKASSLNTLIDFFESSPLIPELISLEVDYPDICPLTKDAPPELSAPPEPPPEKDCCRMSCCPKPTQIDYRLIKRLMVEAIKEQSYIVDIPVVACEFNDKTNLWEPKITYITSEFLATSKEQAQQMAQIHIESAKQTAELCVNRNKNDEPIASVPLSFQIRHEGKTPQMVIQCAEMTRDKDGKWKYGSAKYPITVPHWKGGQNDKPTLPAYRKGNYEGIYVLGDNSKITINAANQAECTKILNALKPWVPKELLDSGYFKGGTINAKIKKTFVQPMYGRYFSQGQRNTKPDWRVNFR